MAATYTGVGSLAWAHRTRGRLSRTDTLRLLAAGTPQLLSELPGVRSVLGLASTRAIEADLSSLRAPDTAAARAAERLCAEVSSESLANHCRRTYLWGVLLGRRDGIDWDDELLYVVCLLHDLGLADRYWRADPAVECFTLDAEEPARELADRFGWDRGRTDALVEAIAMHLNTTVPPSCGGEAHLLRQGSALDVIGARISEVARPARDAVLERHPRLRWKEEITRLFRRELEARPHGRTCFLARYGQFEKRIANAPFAE